MPSDPKALPPPESPPLLGHHSRPLPEPPKLEAEDSTSSKPPQKLKAPFPWFGGKSRVAHIVWQRFGKVSNYVEPFAGSLAVLLGRPHAPRVETVNDIDCYLSNFWRALTAAPDEVAKWADAPVNEADLHARHRWLVNQNDFRERMKTDPDFFDAKIAGWWVWGQCLWIGSGWCQRPEWTGRGKADRKDAGIHKKRFVGTGHGQGHGVHRPFDRNPKGAAHQKRRPHLTCDNGIQQLEKTRPHLSGEQGIANRRWQGGGAGGGSGVHAPSLTRQIPQLSGDGSGAQRGALREEVMNSAGGLYDYLRALASRLRRVRVCCGDWARVVTPSITTYVGLCGVFLDPPYSHELRERCYSEDHDISADVCKWAIDNGDNPKLRIALCGYEGEHQMPGSWECVKWKAHGGYSRTERGKENRNRERIWFSPHCLKQVPELFPT